MVPTIRLTETVKKGGCAAKLPAGTLRQVLSKLDMPRRPELLVGTENLDDACLWDLGHGTLMVQTLDFFTPIVNDPYDFGAIAAANSISDVYAMGGRPATALTILAFPMATLPVELIEPLMAGAIDRVRASGAALAGGHTIDDDTLKLGFSVTGFAPKGRVWKNTGARPGDVLILTKALGTGVLTSALKSGMKTDEELVEAIESMKTLNNAVDYLEGIDIHGATDITGFGLAGHALQMARASECRFEFHIKRLPLFQGTMECLERGILNRAHKTNFDYVKNETNIMDLGESLERWILTDAQTSGGLLLSVSERDCDAVISRLKKYFPATCVVGNVKDKDSIHYIRWIS